MYWKPAVTSYDILASISTLDNEVAMLKLLAQQFEEA